MPGYFLNKLASASNSALLYTAPDGLQGDENMNTFVLEVMAASTCAGLTLKPSSTVLLISTTLPLAIFTNSE